MSTGQQSAEQDHIMPSGGTCSKRMGRDRDRRERFLEALHTGIGDWDL